MHEQEIGDHGGSFVGTSKKAERLPGGGAREQASDQPRAGRGVGCAISVFRKDRSEQKLCLFVPATPLVYGVERRDTIK
jgi:hypothetical protein